MAELFSNNAGSTLLASISNSALSLTIASGEGAKFPNPSGSDYFRATLLKKIDGSIEIVKVTARSGDTFTIVRDFESTGSYSFNAGDIVQLRPTAGMLALLQTEEKALAGSPNYNPDTGAANAYVITPSPAITAYAAGQIFHFKAVNANTGAATLNVNGLGAKTIKKAHDVQLGQGDIESGGIYAVQYDGTEFQLTSTSSNAVFTDLDNTFSGDNIHNGANTVNGLWTFNSQALKLQSSLASTVLQVISTDGGSTEGPFILLQRNSVSPAVNDQLGMIRWDARDSSGNEVPCGAIYAKIIDPTDTSEDAKLVVRTTIGGGYSDRFEFGNGFFASGLLDQGNASINASEFYDDNVQLAPISRLVDISGARSLNTTYQNTTGHPMFVIVCIARAGTTSNFTVKTDASNPPTSIKAVAGNSNASTDIASISFWVIANDYYRVEDSAGTISAWVETT